MAPYYCHHTTCELRRRGEEKEVIGRMSRDIGTRTIVEYCMRSIRTNKQFYRQAAYCFVCLRLPCCSEPMTNKTGKKVVQSCRHKTPSHLVTVKQFSSACLLATTCGAIQSWIDMRHDQHRRIIRTQTTAERSHVA